LIDLPQGLLQIVFAEIRDAGGSRGAHEFGTLTLADRHQGDLSGVASGRLGGGMYPRPDVVHMQPQILRIN
jgi:hypothetical protein